MNNLHDKENRKFAIGGDGTTYLENFAGEPALYTFAERQINYLKQSREPINFTYHIVEQYRT